MYGNGAYSSNGAALPPHLNGENQMRSKSFLKKPADMLDIVFTLLMQVVVVALMLYDIIGGF
jgi:hypothetical protein